VNLLWWIIGWVITSAFLIVITHSMTSWTDEVKSNFTFRVALLGIIMWPMFIVIFISVLIGLYIKKRTST
jgi:uncharacterized membrane protein (DUF106 family)